MKRKTCLGTFLYLILIVLLPFNLVKCDELENAVFVSISGYDLNLLKQKHKLVVKLLDVTYQDAPAITLSKIECKNIIGYQHVVKIPYSKNKIDLRNRYSVHVEIYKTNKSNVYELIYTSPTSNYVITRGNSTNIDIQLVKVTN